MAAPVNVDAETNLNFFYTYIQPLPADAQGFTRMRTIGECSPTPAGTNAGRIELHQWEGAPPGLGVVVKRVDSGFVYINMAMRTNERYNHFRGPERHAEDMLTEIGVYGKSFQNPGVPVPDYILRMHTVFQRGNDVWLVLEHADGGDLFDACEAMHANAAMTMNAISQRVRVWMRQLLQAVSYLHGREVGHRDISLENVLLNGQDVRLMDFGQAVRSHSEAGEELRYFRAAGKPYYRSCNMYVPRHHLNMVAPAGIQGGQVISYPGAPWFFCDVVMPHNVVPGQQCTVTPAGYHVRPADVFACGVCAFVLSTRLPPWRDTNPWVSGGAADPSFVHVCRYGIEALLQAWVQARACRQLEPEALDFLARAMNMDASQRPTSETLLQHQWF
jgi:serine/threonine protein kinase